MSRKRVTGEKTVFRLFHEEVDIDGGMCEFSSYLLAVESLVRILQIENDKLGYHGDKILGTASLVDEIKSKIYEVTITTTEEQSGV